MTAILENIPTHLNRKRPEGLDAEGQPYRILVVDDSSTLRMIVTRILRSESYEIAGEACNGEEAVTLYRELRPDLVTMDINMPEQDGISALREIRSRYADARILMLTGDNEQSQVIEALKGGAAGYVVKTSDRRLILDKVKAALLR